MSFFPNYQPPFYGQPMQDQLAQLMAMIAYPQRQPSSTITQTQQQVQQMSQSSPMIWVGSYQEADNFPVKPGEVVPLWDRNQPYVYRREADQAGKPSTRTFSISEVPEPPKTENDAVTRQEFNVLTKAVGDLVATLNSMAYTPKYEAKESVNDG